MERLDKKIAENHQRQDFLRKRIQSDKEELAKLESEARVLAHSQLAVVFSCEIKDVNTLVTQEHVRKLQFSFSLCKLHVLWRI